MTTTKRRQGRPNVEIPKSKMGTARFSDEEWALIKECATKNNLTVTQLIREGTLEKVRSLQ